VPTIRFLNNLDQVRSKWKISNYCNKNDHIHSCWYSVPTTGLVNMCNIWTWMRSMFCSFSFLFVRFGIIFC